MDTDKRFNVQKQNEVSNMVALPGMVIVQMTDKDDMEGDMYVSVRKERENIGKVVAVGNPCLLTKRYFWEFWKVPNEIKVGDEILLPNVGGQNFVDSEGVAFKIIHHTSALVRWT